MLQALQWAYYSAHGAVLGPGYCTGHKPKEYNGCVSLDLTTPALVCWYYYFVPMSENLCYKNKHLVKNIKDLFQLHIVGEISTVSFRNVWIEDIVSEVLKTSSTLSKHGSSG